MIGPPERKSPARTGILPGSGNLRGGVLEQSYTSRSGKKTAVYEGANDDADFLTSWGPYFEGDEQNGYAATLLPWHGNWAHYEVAPTWWQAMNRAIELAHQTPRCIYVGGSEVGEA